jgi:hypothetical protein
MPGANSFSDALTTEMKCRHDALLKHYRDELGPASSEIDWEH